MIQKNNYLLNIFVVPFLFSFASSNAMLTSILKPAMKPMAKVWSEQQKKEKLEQQILEIASFSTVADVDHEIDKLKNAIYNEALKEIATITKKPHNFLKSEFDVRRIIVRNLLETENPFITQKHSKKIPSFMHDDLITLLKDNNIDPKNVALKYKNNDNPDHFADARGMRFNAQYFPYFKKPRMRIFSGLTSQPLSEQLFTYQHELYHILLHHTFMKQVVLSHVDNPENFKIDKLQSIIEREADIHTASRNLSLARASVDTRCTYGHMQILDPIEHCHDMIRMYALQEQKAKLSKETSKI